MHMYVMHPGFVRQAMEPKGQEELNQGTAERFPTEIGNSAMYTDP